MLVLLKCLGSFGNDNTWSKQALFLGLGKGTIGDYLHRASAGLLTLETSTVAWPDESGGWVETCKSPHCVKLLKPEPLTTEAALVETEDSPFEQQGTEH
ncbi:hypothetical protein PI126_g4059 [Phytophthora idaei]|nr:hypothetical protein PI126_g4059 [Phytophthora idaei]